MSGLTLLEPRWLLALAAVPVLALLGVLALWVRRVAVRRYFGHAVGKPWAGSGSAGLRVAKVVLACIAAGALAVALARPAFNPRPQRVQRSGRDAVFVIDVSRSMLAADLKPSRLERAKLGVRDVLDAAKGDRIGIVAFAGAAVLKCPLTNDYSFVRLSLDDVRPDSVGRGGTAIGDAIRFATSQLLPTDEAAKDGRSRTIFLFTDGEDHESRPLEAAQDAAKKGIRIVTIGLGSELAGAPVPAAPSDRGGRTAGGGTMEYQGEAVVSKMDPGVLRRVAEATPGGVFLNVGTGNIEMDTVYTRLMKSAVAVTQDSTESVRYTELFQALLGLALACMFMEMLIDGWYR
ncbi:MAG TPA: VWA domain-containing protein [Phycisphaerales bacterium]|nr:VWA domain-containing protein [Phycisphaerales bacterium]